MKAYKIPTPLTNEEKAHALRLVIGAIKASLIDRFYHFSLHRFLSHDEVKAFENKKGFMICGPAASLNSVEATAAEWGKTLKIWCPIVLSLDEKSKDKSALLSLQLLFGDKVKSAPEEHKATVAKFIDSAFFMTAIMIVLRHLNTPSDDNKTNFFRDEYLRLKGLASDVHLVYSFRGKFEVPVTSTSSVKFDIITEAEAREAHDVACFTRILDETKDISDNKQRTSEVRKRASNSKCVMYLELKNHADKESELEELSKHNFIVTDNWEASAEMKAAAVDSLKHLIIEHIKRNNIMLPLDTDNTKDIPRIVPPGSVNSTGGSTTSSTKKPDSSKKNAKPDSSKKEKKNKADIKMAPTTQSATMEAERKAEESQKQVWADEISRAMVAELLTHTQTPQGRAKVIQFLNVAAGLSTKKTKVGGDVFNLSTTRLVLAVNNNTGIVIGYVDGAPMFPGRKVALAVNVKSKSVPIQWFKTSKIGTNTHLTSNNSDLVAWVRDQLMPKVWKQFIASFAGDSGSLNAEENDDEMDEEERVENLSTQEQDENDEPVTDYIKKEREFEAEMGFISAHAATLPILPGEADMDKLGGDLSAQRAAQFGVNTAAMNLDRDEINILKVVRENMAELFKSDTQSVINVIRQNIKISAGIPVSPSGKPFEMASAEEAEEGQFTADYRSGVAAKFASDEFADEEEDEEN